MGIEDIGTNINLEKFTEYVVDFMFMVLRYPFDILNGLPAYVRYIVYCLILAFAFLMAVITWKYREAWRYFS